VPGDESVWLLGMRGSGKSTPGPLRPERLGGLFVDTDGVADEVALKLAESYA
jgi:shikimate kinase